MAKNGQVSLGNKIDVVSELVSESINVGRNFGAVDVTRRQHVSQALGFVAASGGQARRAEFGKHLDLAQCNLTRVLHMMATAGLVERTPHGK